MEGGREDQAAEHGAREGPCRATTPRRAQPFAAAGEACSVRPGRPSARAGPPLPDSLACCTDQGQVCEQEREGAVGLLC